MENKEPSYAYDPHYESLCQVNNAPNQRSLPYVEDPPQYAKIEIKQAAVKSSSSPNKRYVFIGVAIGVATVVGLLMIAAIVVMASDQGGNEESPNESTTNVPTTSADYTTATSTIPTTTTEPVGWSCWSAWSECDATCGGGYRERSRECVADPTYCVGSEEQVEPCNEHRCPYPEYGEWSHWSGWTDCTVTCGNGTQLRTRTCNMDADDIECPGEETDTRGCNEHACPECGNPCPPGGTAEMPDCLRCVCSTTVNGIVRDSMNLPIDNAVIADSWAPTVAITTSANDGTFSVQGGCVGSTFIATKAGYVDSHHSVSSTSETIYMQEIVSINIEEHPSDKVRLVGESVTFCCNASGSPPPDYYEWEKDGGFISKHTDGLLVLDNLQKDDAGLYRCRASNDYSSKYSETAELQVGDDQGSFCNEHPLPNEITLPEECIYEGGNIIDVGKCSEDPCRGDGEVDDGRCSEGSTYCCAPTQYETFDVVCEDGLYIKRIFTVSKCGCTMCPVGSVKIVGTAKSVDGKTLLSRGSIYINGSQVAVTDSYGKFEFFVAQNYSRVVATFKDTTYNILADAVKVIHIPKPLPGQELTTKRVSVLMQTMQNSTYSDSASDVVIPLKALNQDTSFGEIHIPANSFYDESGALYTGTVESRVAVADPRNLEDIKASPGEFSYINEMGIPYPIATYGMFLMKFRDDSGNKLLPRYFDTAAVLDSKTKANISLWSMEGFTGQWVELETLERESFNKKWNHKSTKSMRRSDNIMFRTGVRADYRNYDDAWVNYDMQITDDLCYTKIRIFDHNGEDKTQIRPSDNPKVVVQKNSNYFLYDIPCPYCEVSEGEYCMLSECQINQEDPQIHAIIEVECSNEQDYCHPASKDEYDDDDDTQNYLYALDYSTDDLAIYSQLSLSLAETTDQGIFYRPNSYDSTSDIYDSETCSAAEPTETHFWFYQDYYVSDDICEQTSVDDYFQQPTCGSDDALQRNRNILEDFYPEDGSRETVACYIKVAVTGDYSSTAFRALSRVGTYESSELDIAPGLQYGYHNDCPSSNKPFVCLQFRSSGTWFDGCEDYTDETDVIVNQLTGGKNCRFSQISPDLTNEYVLSILNGTNQFGIRVLTDSNGNPQDGVDAEAGIYCETQPVEEYQLAADEALNRCLTGSPDDEDDVTEEDYDSKNSAVVLVCD